MLEGVLVGVEFEAGAGNRAEHSCREVVLSAHGKPEARGVEDRENQCRLLALCNRDGTFSVFNQAVHSEGALAEVEASGRRDELMHPAWRDVVRTFAAYGIVVQYLACANLVFPVYLPKHRAACAACTQAIEKAGALYGVSIIKNP